MSLQSTNNICFFSLSQLYHGNKLDTTVQLALIYIILLKPEKNNSKQLLLLSKRRKGVLNEEKVPCVTKCQCAIWFPIVVFGNSPARQLSNPIFASSLSAKCLKKLSNPERAVVCICKSFIVSIVLFSLGRPRQWIVLPAWHSLTFCLSANEHPRGKAKCNSQVTFKLFHCALNCINGLFH